MRKKNKQIYFIVGIVAAIVALAILSALGKLPFAISGSQTLAISTADLRSDFAPLNGKAWVLTFTQGGLSQSYYGTFSPSQVDAVAPGESKPTKSFTLDVQYSDTVCQYPLKDTEILNPIKDIQYVQFTCPTSFFLPRYPSEAEAKTLSGLSALEWYGKYSSTFSEPLLGNQCFAIGYNTQSPIGNIPTVPNVNSKYTITVDVEGKQASKTIDSLSGSGQGSVGDFAYAVWNGNLVTGRSCELASGFSPTLYKGAYVNGNWRIISDQAYNTYTSNYDSLLRYKATVGSPDKAKLIETAKLVTDSASQAKLSQSVSGQLQNSNSLSSAVLSIATKTPVQSPVTTLYIKADTLGIFTPVADIRLVGTQSDCFQTGTTGILTATIKNFGSQRGSYTAYGQCASPFSTTQNSQGSLEPGETRTVNLPLSAFVQSETRNSCNVFVESVGSVKSISAQVCAKPQVTCLTKTNFCAIEGGREVVKQCSPDGATSSIVSMCSSNEFCDASQAKCVTQTQVSSSSSGSNPFAAIGSFFSNLFSGTLSFLTYLKYFIIAVVSIASVFVTEEFLDRFRGTRKNKGLRWTLAIIFSIGVAIALAMFIGSFIFWIILIGWGVYLFFAPKIMRIINPLRGK